MEKKPFFGIGFVIRDVFKELWKDENLNMLFHPASSLRLRPFICYGRTLHCFYLDVHVNDLFLFANNIPKR